MRQHRRHQAGHVDGQGALGGPAVERRARLDEPGDVRDVDEHAVVVQRERVVEVLRRLGVDRERELVAEVEAALGRRLAQLERLELPALALLDEQPLEHRLDRARPPEHALELRPPAPLAQDGEIAGARLAAATPVQHERHARREVRLAHDELPSPGDFRDYGVACDAALRTHGLCPCVRLNRPVEPLDGSVTARGNSDAEETVDRDSGAGGAEQESRAEDDQHVDAERPGVHVRVAQVDDVPQEDRAP